MSPFAIANILLMVTILGNGVIGDVAYIPFGSYWITDFRPYYHCPEREVITITRITSSLCCGTDCWQWNLSRSSYGYKMITSRCDKSYSCPYIAAQSYNSCLYITKVWNFSNIWYFTVYFTCNPNQDNSTETTQTSPSSSDFTEKWMQETLPKGEEFIFPLTTASDVPTAPGPTAAASSGSLDVKLVAGVTVGVVVLVIVTAILAAIFVCRKRGRKEPTPAVGTDNVYSGAPTRSDTETSVNLQPQLGQAIYPNHDDELVIEDNANYATHGNIMTTADNGADDLVIQDNINYATHGGVMTADNNADDLVLQDNINYATHGDVMNDDLVVEDNKNYAAY